MSPVKLLTSEKPIHPLVWLAVVLSKRDGEMACDEGALRKLGDGERRAYGETLLKLVTAPAKPADLFSCATTMTGGKRSLAERIRHIVCQPKRLVSDAITVVLLSALALGCAFTGAEEKIAGDGGQDTHSDPVEGVLPELPEVDDTAPELDDILSGIRAESITTIDHPRTVTAKALADALNGAVGKWTTWEGSTTAGFYQNLYPYWSICAAYIVPAWSASEQTVLLEAGLTENVVRITCSGYYAGILYSENPSEGGTYLHDNEYRYTVLAEDEALYGLVRRANDYPKRIERGLISPLRELVIAEQERQLSSMQGTDPEAGYSGYELTEFYTLAAYDDIVPGAEVVIYEYRFVLTLEHPEQAKFFDAMYLDSALRMDGLHIGQIAGVWQDGELIQCRYLASDISIDPESEVWMEKYGKPYIRQALADPDFW